ncbi:unnamed protein product [Rhodiola kirilowii]
MAFSGFTASTETYNPHAFRSSCYNKLTTTTNSLVKATTRVRYTHNPWRGSVSFPLLGLNGCCNSPRRFLCSSQLEKTRDEKCEPIDNGSFNFRTKLNFRLRPRLRLLVRRLRRRVSVRSMMDGVVTFLRKNAKKLTFSTLAALALGVCYVFLKLSAVPTPHIVLYSHLVSSIRDGSVTNVLLEEGSKRIYFNINSQHSGDKGFLEDGLAPGTSVGERKEESVSSDDVQRSNQMAGADALKKSSKTRVRPSAPEWQYSTRKIDHDEKFLLSLMREQGTSYSSAPPSVLSSFRSIVITILTLWIPLTPLMWLLYRQLSAANSPAKKRRATTQIVTFDDVEGVDAAKVELMEIVLCMQGAINYQKLGAKLPRGVLLVGPPGTGKTLLARAVAGEAGVPFFTVSASEFVEMFVGRGAARIRDLFSAARKCSPSIIFIDELDAVGGKRGRSFNDERDQTLNQLLTEMDGFETDSKVVVVAATNRPEALDPALCRPGRFSRKVVVGEPDEDGRRKILAVHFRGVPLEEDIDLICSLVASVTQGFVGADLANIVNEAALLAARRGGEIVTREDIMEAIERAKFGINDRIQTPGTLSKEIEKLFPWMPSLMGKNNSRQDGSQGPLSYRTMS